MTVERPQLAAIGHIPELDRAVVARGCQCFAVGTQSRRIQAILVAAKFFHKGAALHVKEPRLAEQARFARGSDDILPIVRKRDAVDAARNATERAQRLPSLKRL